MQLRQDRPVIRVLGVCFGVGLLALGLAGLLGFPPPPETIGASRVFGYGVVLFVAGLATVVASLTIADPTTIF